MCWIALYSVKLKVDIFQMSVLEMFERAGQPLFHVEHFIEGKYVKYNSNSGFVRSDATRMTPQAFSHFTFERCVMFTLYICTDSRKKNFLPGVRDI